VVHSSAQDKRQQQRLERDLQTSQSTLQTVARPAEQQEYLCRADADAAAAPRRAVPTAYHRVDVTVAERPLYGRGRPSSHKPRTVKAMRYMLKTPLKPASERISRRAAAAGCFVRLPNVPTTGPLAPSPRDILTVDKEPHGTEQNYGCLKDPVMVQSLFLKQPERIEACGLVVLWALLIWRLRERAMRRHVDTTSTSWPGWDKQATERPTSCMRITQFAGVIVVKLGHDRQLARPLAAGQHQYLTALAVPATCFTLPAGERRTALAARRLSRRHQRLVQW
jgi:transposase